MTDTGATTITDSSSARISCPILTLVASIAVLIVFNILTQPFEDSVGDVAPTKAYFLDVVWYLDDIIGPALFLTAGLTLLRRMKFRFRPWQVAGLGLSCMAFALGDTADAHWVVPEATHVIEEAISFSSWISKIMVVITFCFFITHAYDAFERTAQKWMVIGFFLLFIDQIQMSISFDFAGYSFHVFEESLEVVIGLIFCLGVGCRRFDAARLNSFSAG